MFSAADHRHASAVRDMPAKIHLHLASLRARWLPTRINPIVTANTPSTPKLPPGFAAAHCFHRSALVLSRDLPGALAINIVKQLGLSADQSGQVRFIRCGPWSPGIGRTGAEKIPDQHPRRPNPKGRTNQVRAASTGKFCSSPKPAPDE